MIVLHSEIRGRHESNQPPSAHTHTPSPPAHLHRLQLHLLEGRQPSLPFGPLRFAAALPATRLRCRGRGGHTTNATPAATDCFWALCAAALCVNLQASALVPHGARRGVGSFAWACCNSWFRSCNSLVIGLKRDEARGSGASGGLAEELRNLAPPSGQHGESPETQVDVDGGAVACSTGDVLVGTRKGDHADGQLYMYRKAEVGGEVGLLTRRISKGEGEAGSHQSTIK